MSNSLREERMQILKMIENGKVSSEDGLELLEALNDKTSEITKTKAKWLKVRIFDPYEKSKVNVNIPISLVNFGLKFATKFSPELKGSEFEELDFKEIVAAIKNGAEGKIVDITSEEKGERVEVFVE